MWGKKGINAELVTWRFVQLPLLLVVLKGLHQALAQLANDRVYTCGLKSRALSMSMAAS